jgi:hypothetical protein
MLISALSCFETRSFSLNDWPKTLNMLTFNFLKTCLIGRDHHESSLTMRDEWSLVYRQNNARNADFRFITWRVHELMQLGHALELKLRIGDLCLVSRLEVEVR